MVPRPAVSGQMSTLLCRRAKLPDPQPFQSRQALCTVARRARPPRSAARAAPKAQGRQRCSPARQRISAPSLARSAARQSVVATVATWTRRSLQRTAVSPADMGRHEVPAAQTHVLGCAVNDAGKTPQTRNAARLPDLRPCVWIAAGWPFVWTQSNQGVLTMRVKLCSYTAHFWRACFGSSWPP
jgi:hypothetical protein